MAGKNNNKLKVGRESPGFLLRMPISLREELKREATVSDRSMNTVILSRLKGSVDKSKKDSLHDQPGMAEYYALNEIERSLFTILKRLPLEKQMALMTLLK